MNALFPSEAEVAFHASIVVYGIILAFFATLLTAILFLQIPSDKKGVVPISTSIFFFYVLIFQDIPMFTSTLPYRYSYIVPDFIIDVVSLVFYFTITTFVFKRSKES